MRLTTRPRIPLRRWRSVAALALGIKAGYSQSGSIEAALGSGDTAFFAGALMDEEHQLDG
jgi:hypothetical protein